MYSAPLKKTAAWILLLLLLISLFCLPAFALPDESETGNLSDVATTDLTDNLTDGLTDGLLPDDGMTDGLPNTDNGIADDEGIIDATSQNGTSTSVTTERDPIDAAGNAAGGANWVTIVICIVIVIAIILIIVALIPKKHK